uniref:Uncharacterized protein n=1 Tax=Caenorhabditis japonica TaxID=281687 RepID=A0A8R1E642_CAEJA
MKKVLELNVHQRRARLENLLVQYPTGVRFNSRIWIDTAFCISDALVTIIYGELSEFMTASSGKNTCIVLSIMCHSSKETEHHVMHAKHFSNILNNMDQDKAVVCVTIDGETALENYAKELNAWSLRCDIHRSDNLKNKCPRVFPKIKRLVFGELKGTTWKQGLISVYSSEEFDERFEKLKDQNCPPAVQQCVTLFMNDSVVSHAEQEQSSSKLTEKSVIVDSWQDSLGAPVASSTLNDNEYAESSEDSSLGTKLNSRKRTLSANWFDSVDMDDENLRIAMDLDKGRQGLKEWAKNRKKEMYGNSFSSDDGAEMFQCD